MADRADYFDRNGKATATDEELTEHLKNIYCVLLARGIYGTHVYVVDPGLREWLRGVLRTGGVGSYPARPSSAAAMAAAT